MNNHQVGGASARQIGRTVKLRDTTTNQEVKREGNLIVHSGTEEYNKFTHEENPYYDPTYTYDRKVKTFLDKNTWFSCLNLTELVK